MRASCSERAIRQRVLRMARVLDGARSLVVIACIWNYHTTNKTQEIETEKEWDRERDITFSTFSFLLLLLLLCCFISAVALWICGGNGDCDCGCGDHSSNMESQRWFYTYEERFQIKPKKKCEDVRFCNCILPSSSVCNRQQFTWLRHNGDVTQILRPLHVQPFMFNRYNCNLIWSDMRRKKIEFVRCTWILLQKSIINHRKSTGSVHEIMVLLI